MLRPHGKNVSWATLCFLTCRASRPQRSTFQSPSPITLSSTALGNQPFAIRSTMDKDFLWITAWLFVITQYLSPIPCTAENNNNNVIQSELISIRKFSALHWTFLFVCLFYEIISSVKVETMFGSPSNPSAQISVEWMSYNCGFASISNHHHISTTTTPTIPPSSHDHHPYCHQHHHRHINPLQLSSSP